MSILTMSSLKRGRRDADHYPDDVHTWRVLMPECSTELQEFHRYMIRRALRQGSIDGRMSVLVRAELAIGHPLASSTTLELQTWLDQHRLNAKTRYSYISHLSAFWTWALIEELVTRNPTLRLARPKLRRTLPRPISTDDLNRLIDQSPTHELRAMITLAGFAGLRCMEIAGLLAEDVMEHLTPPVLLVAHGKGDKPRVMPMGAPIIVALHAHGIPSYGPVFRDVGGDALPPWKVSKIIRDHMHNCNVIASAHQLRHTYGTEVYRKSGDLRMTQELMGHESPATTAGYTAWANDKAAAVVDTLFT